MSNIKYLTFLFDLDGTLVDSLPDIHRSTNSLREELGLAPLEIEPVRLAIGHGVETLVQKCLPTELVESRGAAFLVERYRYFYRNSRSQARLYPKVSETLAQIKGQSKGEAIFGIVTNRNSHSAERSVRELLPSIEFSIVAGPDRVSERKPSPKHIWEALKGLNREATGALYVGDHLVDYECANSAGVAFIGAEYGYGDLPQQTPQKMECFSELLKLSTK